VSLLMALAPLALVACAALPEDAARPLNPDAYVVVETTVEPLPLPVLDDPTTSVAAVVYLIRDGGLISRGRVVDDALSLGRSIELLVEGPSVDEISAGYRSGLTNRADLIIDSRIEQDIALIALDEGLDSFSGDEQILILGQIVLTSLTVPGVSAVQFLRSNEPLSVIAPNGNSLVGPIVRSDFAVLLSR
jgi:spore germination protein GerM